MNKVLCFPPKGQKDPRISQVIRVCFGYIWIYSAHRMSYAERSKVSHRVLSDGAERFSITRKMMIDDVPTKLIVSAE